MVGVRPNGANSVTYDIFTKIQETGTLFWSASVTYLNLVHDWFSSREHAFTSNGPDATGASPVTSSA